MWGTRGKEWGVHGVCQSDSHHTHTSGECYKGESRHKPRTIVDEDAAIDDGVRGGEMLEYTVQCLAPRTPAPQKTGKPTALVLACLDATNSCGDRN